MNKNLMQNDSYHFFLLLGVFFSNLNTFFIALSISSLIYKSTGSNLLSASIFAANWIGPIILAYFTLKIMFWLGQKKTLLFATILQITFLALFYIWDFNSSWGWVVYVLFAVRGYISSLEHTASQLILKQTIVGTASLEKSASYLSACKYAGMVMGATVSALMIDFLNIYYIVVAAFLINMIVMTFYLLVKASENENAYKSLTMLFSKDSLKLIVKSNLRRPFAGLILAVCAFQAYHQIARTAYTVEYLKLPLSSISIIQILTTCSVMLGAFSVGKILHSRSFFGKKDTYWFVFIASVFQASTMIFKEPLFGLLGYFIFIFFFEVSYTKFQNEVIINSTEENSSVVLTLLNTLSVFFMGISVIILGQLTDYFGLKVTNIITVIICMVIASSAIFMKSHKTNRLAKIG